VRRILPNGIRQLYAYDNAGRLAQIKYQRGDNTLIEQIDYSYDAIGQRTSKTLLNGAEAAETPMSASYDSANRMTQVTLSAAAGTKTYGLGYDDNGNLTQKQNTQDASDKTTYNWDARNRLVGLTQPNAQASFSYDRGGRRIAKPGTKGGKNWVPDHQPPSSQNPRWWTAKFVSSLLRLQ
jgi:YD repeat-containing protein